MIQLSRRFINIANSGLKIPLWLSNVPVRVRPYASFLYGNVISESIYSEREWKDMERTKMFKKIESEGEIILIREKRRDEREKRDIDKDRSEINWDKVAEVYGIEELIKNIKF